MGFTQIAKRDGRHCADCTGTITQDQESFD